MADSTILVHVDVDERPVLAGRLFMRTLRARQSASFEYDAGWLSHPQRFALDPVQLPLSSGAFHTAGGEKLFAGLSDSAPDRWGRTLMNRQARAEGRATIFESDYLLRVHDVARQGALRLSIAPDGPFLADDARPIPPLVRLGELLSASDVLQTDESDRDALRLLLAPGSSLGGARPKASVIDASGRLAIAKFPAVADDWPVVVWEVVVHALARAAGIVVAECRLVDVAGRSVLVTQRFDRVGARRIAFLSALALVGGSDGDVDRSYLEIADALRRDGSQPNSDLRELWLRMAFSVLVSNTDDHLRNHGVLRGADGWRLSPAFDLNPVPLDVKPRVHALALDETRHESSLAVVLAVAPHFGLTLADARRSVRALADATARWRDVARAHGLGSTSIDRMETAFEHQDAVAARKLG